MSVSLLLDAAEEAASAFAGRAALGLAAGLVGVVACAFLLAGAWLELDARYGASTASLIVGGALLALSTCGALRLAALRRRRKRAAKRRRAAQAASQQAALTDAFLVAMRVGQALR